MRRLQYSPKNELTYRFGTLGTLMPENGQQVRFWYTRPLIRFCLFY